ncbi:MAG: hypothetical protein BWX71_02025 [Deltaproteobacteria bacterium ADurb.Bin072]|nr:MAG: hypothetical protein BWX71_02025 [Deltaproteobacteria bacterium ADurb.Bin072]
MLEPVLVELLPDDTDTSVHHVRGGDDVCAGPGMGECHGREHLQGIVVADLSLVVEDAAVAVVRVLAEAHVGHDQELRGGILDAAHGLLHHAVLVVGRGAGGILHTGDAEQEDSRYPLRGDLPGKRGQLVGGVPELTGHGLYGLLEGRAFLDEDGVDQVIHAEVRLPDHPPDRLIASQPAGSVLREHGFLRSGQWLGMLYILPLARAS